MLPDCADRDEVHRKLGAAVGVDNASFELKSGKVVMIMGPSGPDKSTTIRLLNWPFRPTSGGIFLDDRACTHVVKRKTNETQTADR